MPPKNPLNLNTLFLAVLLGLSTYTVKGVAELKETNAALVERIHALERVVYRETTPPPATMSALARPE